MGISDVEIVKLEYPVICEHCGELIYYGVDRMSTHYEKKGTDKYYKNGFYSTLRFYPFCDKSKYDLLAIG